MQRTSTLFIIASYGSFSLGSIIFVIMLFLRNLGKGHKVVLYKPDTIYIYLLKSGAFLCFLFLFYVTILIVCSFPTVLHQAEMLWKYHTAFSCNYEVVCLLRHTCFGADLCLGTKLQNFHLGNTI